LLLCAPPQNRITVWPTFQYLRCIQRTRADRHHDGFGLRSLTVRWASAVVSLKQRRWFRTSTNLDSIVGLPHQAALTIRLSLTKASVCVAGMLPPTLGTY
jgi:hypothetical protein